MTCPEIGNYGVTDDDRESTAPHVAGFIVREESPIASNWRAQGTLRDYFIRHNIVAIADIDTRALTRKLRSGCVMRGVVMTGSQLDPNALVDKARAILKMEGSDLVRGVTTSKPFDFVANHHDDFAKTPGRTAKTRLNIAAYDFGMKRTAVPPQPTAATFAFIRDGSASSCCDETRWKAAATALAIRPCRRAIENAKQLESDVRCPASVSVTRSWPRDGGTTFKLKFSHRGANPSGQAETVMAKVEITSNHVSRSNPSLPDDVEGRENRPPHRRG